MEKSLYYYQLKHSIRASRKLAHKRARAYIAQLLNEMRVREYAKSYRCGLAEFGLKHDPTAARLCGRIK